LFLKSVHEFSSLEKRQQPKYFRENGSEGKKFLHGQQIEHKSERKLFSCPEAKAFRQVEGETRETLSYDGSNGKVSIPWRALSLLTPFPFVYLIMRVHEQLKSRNCSSREDSSASSVGD
jgi:hypothetical protein